MASISCGQLLSPGLLLPADLQGKACCYGNSQQGQGAEEDDEGERRAARRWWGRLRPLSRAGHSLGQHWRERARPLNSPTFPQVLKTMKNFVQNKFLYYLSSGLILLLGQKMNWPCLTLIEFGSTVNPAPLFSWLTLVLSVDIIPLLWSRGSAWTAINPTVKSAATVASPWRRSLDVVMTSYRRLLLDVAW